MEYRGENRPKEWWELEKRAIELLDNPDLLPKDAVLKFYQPILRLWIYRSLSTHKAWVFYEGNFQTIKVESLIVREITWDRMFDSERLLSPLQGLKYGFDTNPRINIRSIEISKEIFEGIFSELKQINFPAFINYRKSFGIDGEEYGVEAFEFTHRTKISWWSDYPEEWQVLIEWFEHTTDLIENQFSKKYDA